MNGPVDSGALKQRARALLELGRAEDALLEVHRALGMNPNDPECLEIEGLCRLRLGEHALALDALGRAIAEAPNSPHAHYLYGFALREAGRSEEAKVPLETALRLDADEPVYLRALAELSSDLRLHEAALGLARRAAELAPDRSANHVTYGYVASQAGDKVLARAEYERAVSLDPSDAAAWNNLGCLDLEAGRVLKARARFREALRLDPRGERAQRNLRMVLGPAPQPRDRSWPGTVEALAAELARAKVDRLLLLAFLLEEPRAAQVFVRWRGRGAAISAAATALALSAMGTGAVLPLSVGAAVAGATWLATRSAMPELRLGVRRALARGRHEHERLWRDWLSGAMLREARDQAIDLLVERLAIALYEREELR